MNERVKIKPDLKSACLSEALDVIRDVGIEDLSLREVARRLGVSHQAPYRHFASRDHLLAEIVIHCFERFDAHLAQTPTTDDAMADLHRMGELYLDYAARYPLEYHIMFGAKLPDAEAHPEMLERSCASFEHLREALARIFETGPDDARVAAEALYIWSALHGFASIRQSGAMDKLGIEPDVQAVLSQHILGQISKALRPDGARAS